MISRNDNSKSYDILLLTSYPGLDKVVEPYLKKLEPKYSSKITKYKSLFIPDEDIVKDINENCKVIISRGYPATACKKLTNKYVVEVHVSFQDVINAINEVIDQNTKRIAVIAYSNIVNEKNSIVRFGDFQIYFLTLNNRKKDKEIITKYLQENNIDAVVGSALVYETTVDSNIPFKIIKSSHESIQKAIDEAILFIDNSRELNRKKSIERKSNIERGWTAKYTFSDILGESNATKATKALARRYSKSQRSILITGETGTGKELLAQSIHNESDRFDKPFISINCGELSDSLIESELFGYERGAYTGANKFGNKGLILSANGGTLFLDEINDASMKLQTKLLRVIEERKIRRIGSTKLDNIDVRIICATNRDLKSLVENKLFKKDLYYRLNELDIEIPSLRDRKQDIYYLAKYFSQKEFFNEYRRSIKINENTFSCLLKHDWPGNIRELKSFILKMIYFSEGRDIDEKLVNDFFTYTFGCEVEDTVNYIKIPIIKDRKLIDREIYKKLLIYYKGDRERLCKDYNINRTTLWRKLNAK